MLGLSGARSLLAARQPMRVRALHAHIPSRARPCALLPTGSIARHALYGRRSIAVSVVRREDAKPAPPPPPPSPPMPVPTEDAPAPAPPPGRFARMLPPAWRAEPGSRKSLRKMVALAAPERKPLTAAVGLLLVSSAVTMTVPLTIGKLIDYFSAPDPTIPFGLSLTSASGILLLAFTVGAAANAGRAIIMKLCGQRIVARLRENMYAASLRQEVEFVEKGEGDVLSRLSLDTSIVGESLTQNLSDGLRSAITATAGLIAMFWLSPSITLLMLSIVPPVSLGAVFYGRYLKRLSNRTQEALGDMSKVAQEALSAARTVQAFNAQPFEQRKFDAKVAEVLDLARKEAYATGIFFGSTGWSGNLTILALLGYGGSQVASGFITVGDLTSLLLYTAYVGGSLQTLTSFFASIMRGLGATGRIFSLLDREPTIPAHPTNARPLPTRVADAPSGMLRFERVRFAYPSRPTMPILDDFTLDVTPGESVALVGQSGSGKSSVNALLLRYYDPSAGRITFDGVDIREFDPSAWRSMIGVVPQDPVLFRGTIAENIAYGAPDTPRAEIERAARAANCEFVWGMPHGFDTTIGRNSLSGGQRQRLAIARALLKRPAILALDEATSALDAASERRVNDAVERVLRDGRTTCFIVAHRLSTIARADRIVVLEDGHITESGTYRALVAREDSRFRALMAAQLTAATGESPASASSDKLAAEKAKAEAETSEEEAERTEEERAEANVVKS